MAHCSTCKHNYKPKDCEPRCNHMCDGISDYEPQTNADRINTMSAEEKAEWLFEHDRITAEKGRLSKEELLQWLKSEAKG